MEGFGVKSKAKVSAGGRLFSGHRLSLQDKQLHDLGNNLKKLDVNDDAIREVKELYAEYDIRFLNMEYFAVAVRIWDYIVNKDVDRLRQFIAEDDGQIIILENLKTLLATRRRKNKSDDTSNARIQQIIIYIAYINNYKKEHFNPDDANPEEDDERIIYSDSDSDSD